MPKIVDREAQRRRIRRAACEVFAERGLDGTGLSHVAQRAGMGRASLYHYYRTKEALIADLASELLDEEVAAFRKAADAPGGNALERLTGVIREVAHAYEPLSTEGRLVVQFWVTHPERLRKALAEIRASLARLIRLGQRRGEIRRQIKAEAAAAALVALIDGLILQLYVDPKAFAGREALADTLAAATARLLAP